MTELIILTGLPASGKSTWATEWAAQASDRVRINYDDLRRTLYGDGWRFNRKEEDAMQAAARKLVIDALDADKSVVIDNTNLSTKVVNGWEALGREHGAVVSVRAFDASVQECVRRDALRTGKARVGRAVIERMALFNNLIPFEGKQHIIVDVDGTIADCSHRKHLLSQRSAHSASCANNGVALEPGTRCACGSKVFKDWVNFFLACGKDTPITPVINLVRHFRSLGYNILIVSGRAIDLCGEKTVTWLDGHYVPYDHIFMRQGGDGRVDTVVKQEILDKILLGMPKDRIAYVIDDRPSVLRMWRSAGLTTLAVGDGNEF